MIPSNDPQGRGLYPRMDDAFRAPRSHHLRPPPVHYHHHYRHEDSHASSGPFASFLPPPPPLGEVSHMVDAVPTAARGLMESRVHGGMEYMDNENVPSAPDENSTKGSKKVAKKGLTVPPPRQPRTAFVCFSDSQRDHILAMLRSKSGAKKKDEDAHLDVSPPPSPSQHAKEFNDDVILEVAADLWGDLSHHNRAFWDEEARNDKVRYVKELASYQCPMGSKKRRAKKHPGAPKRPMSAFLKFSQARRASVKEGNPELSNTDISRLLGAMWRQSSEAEKKEFVEDEILERALYNKRTKLFREEQKRLDAASRNSQGELPSACSVDDSQADQHNFHPPPDFYQKPQLSAFVHPNHLDRDSFFLEDRHRDHLRVLPLPMDPSPIPLMSYKNDAGSSRHRPASELVHSFRPLYRMQNGGDRDFELGTDHVNSAVDRHGYTDPLPFPYQHPPHGPTSESSSRQGSSRQTRNRGTIYYFTDPSQASNFMPYP